MPSSAVPDLPKRSDYGRRLYRRCIRLEAVGERVRGELADDFHHFGVELRHDGAAVRSIAGNDIRIPWTTCGGSLAVLDRLVGLELTHSLFTVARHTDPRLQCTHLFDLAALAVCHAARATAGAPKLRRYDIALPDRVDSATDATLARDGEGLLSWRIEGARVARSEPSAFVGRTLLGAAFNEFVEHELAPDLAEAALVFRRAVMIGLGRQYDFDRIRRAADFARIVGSACHTFHPDRLETATRIVGSGRDFTDSPDQILGIRPEPRDRTG